MRFILHKRKNTYICTLCKTSKKKSHEIQIFMNRMVQKKKVTQNYICVQWTVMIYWGVSLLIRQSVRKNFRESFWNILLSFFHKLLSHMTAFSKFSQKFLGKCFPLALVHTSLALPQSPPFHLRSPIEYVQQEGQEKEEIEQTKGQKRVQAVPSPVFLNFCSSIKHTDFSKRE